MTVYFKVFDNKDIENALNSFKEKASEFKRKVRDLADELGATHNALISFDTGVHAFEFKEAPDLSVWKKFNPDRYHHNTYCPKKNTKKGKEIAKKMKDIGTVPKTGLATACGYKDMLFSNDDKGTVSFLPSIRLVNETILIGYPEYAFSEHNKESFNLPEGLQEITYSEYLEITGK